MGEKISVLRTFFNFDGSFFYKDIRATPLKKRNFQVPDNNAFESLQDYQKSQIHNGITRFIILFFNRIEKMKNFRKEIKKLRFVNF